jgi:hypothetical protein
MVVIIVIIVDVIQFGFVTMFSACFPLAPALAMASNYFEFNVDLLKFATCRRPLRHANISPSSDAQRDACVGAWAQCLEVVGFVSIFTNLFVLTLIFNDVMTAYTPTVLGAHMDASVAR